MIAPVPRYPDYAALPEHLREMLRAVTKDDAAAERYAHAPNKNLRGRSVMEMVNFPFGQKVVERFLFDLCGYLGVEGFERFRESFGRRR
jgi:hypothetical protein